MNIHCNGRRDFLKAVGIGAASLSMSRWLSAGEGAEEPWLVGYADADVTPKPGQCMMSGFGRERYANGTLAPLLTQVLALRDREGKTAVLIAADILGFDRTTVEAIRQAIARKHGIAAECVLCAASHTHWGPAVKLNIGFAVTRQLWVVEG